MADLTTTQHPSGRKLVTYTAQVTRSDTSNTATGTILPKGFVPAGVRVLSPAASNAGTSATISVGSTNATTGVIVSALDVKGSAGIGQSIPSTFALAGQSLPADTVITVQYTEGGSASSAGGPWTVFIDGFIV